MTSIPPIHVLRTRLEAFRLTLQGASDSRKKGNVSLALAGEFNGVLGEVRRLLPDLGTGLPKDVSLRGFGASMDLAPISYLDLEMLVDQALAIMALVEAD